MKQKIINILVNGTTGIGFGSFSYLLILLFKIQSAFPTAKNIISIWIMSFLIGLLTHLFSQGITIKTLLIHFSATFALVVAMIAYNGWITSPTNILTFSGAFFAIYLLIWAIVIFFERLSINKINRKLAEKQRTTNN
ncbi:DUF3021 domain-containing protein [Lactobacillus sp. ESL0681]|uniref:DUF3021 domain-containing protein n=1 Tax=Lactobacillus sp. ESL0681 TaxID=2983211 RepID=UPI0023F7A906|nr:DUF3021 domain-containing protein [Lactobacillus sp. ESL0681]WEV41010.1 DUF3021 domain-containing protein [Lactobacillus sp. ESL0681]